MYIDPISFVASSGNLSVCPPKLNDYIQRLDAQTALQPATARACNPLMWRSISTARLIKLIKIKNFDLINFDLIKT